MEEKNNVERIFHGTLELAIIIPSQLEVQDTTFFTSKDDSLQVGVSAKSVGTYIDPHFHLERTRTVLQTQEVLCIIQGKVKVTFFTQEKKVVAERLLGAGDCILIKCGGHSFVFLEKTKFLIIKQGPYLDVTQDKVFFEENTSATV